MRIVVAPPTPGEVERRARCAWLMGLRLGDRVAVVAPGVRTEGQVVQATAVAIRVAVGDALWLFARSDGRRVVMHDGVRLYVGVHERIEPMS